MYVARKLAQRRGTPIPSGSRVPYVFVEDLDNPDCLQAEKAEDPEYVRENGVALDVLYYLEHQLKSPIEALLVLLMGDPVKEVFGHPSIKPTVDALARRRDEAVKTFKRVQKNRTNRQMEITNFFASK